MKLTTYLATAVLSLTSTTEAIEANNAIDTNLATSADHKPWFTDNHFKVQFRRYPDSTCSDTYENKKHVRHGYGDKVAEGSCKSWEKNQPFESYQFHWRHHAGERRPKHKTCMVIVYAEADCEGEPIQILEGVSRHLFFVGCWM
jgi:hypothetical protein